MEFKRSISGQRPMCALGPRVHVNTLTSAIDANFVYGSDENLARKLRSFRGGEFSKDVLSNTNLTVQQMLQV